MVRHLTSVILVLMLAAVMVLGYFVSEIFIDLLIVLFAFGAVYEMRKSLMSAGYKMFIAPVCVMLVASYPTFYLMQTYLGAGREASVGLQGLLIVFLVCAILTLTIFTFRPSDSSSEMGSEIDKRACGLSDLFANIFLLVYPALFFSAAWVLSYKYGAFFAILFAIIVPIIGSDTFAYLFGVTIKGKKLCPKISPKKTVAGAVGGVFGGMVLAILFWLVFEYVGSIAPNFAAHNGYLPFFAHSEEGWMWKSALVYLVLGMICGAVSEFGDLAASRIKRAIGIKDYGKIFPGHGGILDRVDSVLYCIVVLLISFSIIYGY